MAEPRPDEDPQDPETAAASGADAAADSPQALAPVTAPRRDQAFRRELIKRLPRLDFVGWSAKDNVRIDEAWESLANLRADALLEALEQVAPERLR